MAVPAGSRPPAGSLAMNSGNCAADNLALLEAFGAATDRHGVDTAEAMQAYARYAAHPGCLKVAAAGPVEASGTVH